MKNPHWEVGQKVHVFYGPVGRRSTVSTSGVVTKIQNNGVMLVEYSYDGWSDIVTSKFSGKGATEDCAWETQKNALHKLMIQKVTPELIERAQAAKERVLANKVRLKIQKKLEQPKAEWSHATLEAILKKLEENEFSS